MATGRLVGCENEGRQGVLCGVPPVDMIIDEFAVLVAGFGNEWHFIVAFDGVLMVLIHLQLAGPG